MKKLAIVAAAAAALTSAHAAPFNGFSLGGNIGVAVKKSDFTQGRAIYGSLYAGYTKSFASSLFAGADLYGSVEKFSDAAIFGLGLAPRIGFKFNETTAMYIAPKVGVDFMPSIIKDSGYKSSMMVFTPTLGLEKAFNNVSLRGEIGYQFGTAKSSKANVDNMKKTRIFVTFGAGYNF